MVKRRPMIHFAVTEEAKKRIDDLAKEYNTTISGMMRILIEDVLGDEEMENAPEFRAYRRRKIGQDIFS